MTVTVQAFGSPVREDPLAAAPSTVEHLMVCRRSTGGWLNLWWESGEPHVIEARQAPSILGPVDRLLSDMRRFPGVDVSFTTRTSEELIGEPVVEDAASLAAAAPGASITILLPEREPSGVWTLLWRDGRGVIHAGGSEARFQPATLADQIQAFIKREDPKSFEPFGTADLRPAAMPLNKPTCARELLIRHRWIAATIAGLPELNTARPPGRTAEQEKRLRWDRTIREGRERTRRNAETSRRIDAHNARNRELRSRPKLNAQELALIKPT